jgi:hypothetical protein
MTSDSSCRIPSFGEPHSLASLSIYRKPLSRGENEFGDSRVPTRKVENILWDSSEPLSSSQVITVVYASSLSWASAAL